MTLIAILMLSSLLCASSSLSLATRSAISLGQKDAQNSNWQEGLPGLPEMGNTLLQEDPKPETDLISATQRTALDPVRLRALRARWTAAAEKLGVPGMAIAVVSSNGEVWLDTFGVRDRERNLPVTSRTRFYIASCTKPFVALAVRLFVERGDLNLDAPVHRYLPLFELADRQLTSSVTVRDLLAHRKGIKSWPITFGEAYTGQMTDERFYRLLKRVRTEGDFEYSNQHYTLLGKILESVSGTSWKTVLRREVLVPAGMTRTTCSSPDAYMDPNIARAYRLRDGKAQAAAVSKTDRTMHSAGGIFSTADDLVRWLKLQLAAGRINGRQVWSEGVVRDLRQSQIKLEEAHPLVPDQKRVAWGLGWELRDLRGMRLVVHGGHYEGSTAHMSFLPDRQVGVIILANAGDPTLWLAEAIAGEIYDNLLGVEVPNLVERVVESARTPQAQQEEDLTILGELRAGPSRPTRPLHFYVGRYIDSDWGTLDVYLRGKELSMRIGDLPLPIVWTGPDRFVAGGDHAGVFVIENQSRVRAVRLGMPLPDTGTFVRR